MKHAGTIAVVAMSVWLLPGCAPKKPRVKPPRTAQAPTTNDQAGVMYPAPLKEKTETPPPPAPEPAPPQETAPAPIPQQEPPAPPKKKFGRSKSKPSAAKAAPASPAPAPAETTTAPAPSAPASAPAQQTANVEPSGVSPIGQLSSGEGATGSQKRHDTSDLITSTEQGLNGIKRALSMREQETASQIRAYLKQAKKALTADDIDGATTLATKAKLLLEELTKP